MLRAWIAAGAHRRDADGDDAPVDAEAWCDGWYGQVEQDMRDVLNKHPSGASSRVGCGGSPSASGKLAACRSVLPDSLAAAAETVADAQGTSEPTTWTLPTTCPIPGTGVPACDEIVFYELGAVATPSMAWQDRPTYQQVVAFP